jgi:salicylate hydroxylase
MNILGLADELLKLGAPVDDIVYYSQRTNPTTELMTTTAPSEVRIAEGWPIMGIGRDAFVKFLIEKAKERGVPIELGKGVKTVKEEGDKVKVTLTDGSEDEADLVVGADGLHSAVRDGLFGKVEADFLKLVEVFAPLILSLTIV